MAGRGVRIRGGRYKGRGGGEWGCHLAGGEGADHTDEYSNESAHNDDDDDGELVVLGGGGVSL